jgi:hypothetical protein
VPDLPRRAPHRWRAECRTAFRRARHIARQAARHRGGAPC